MQRKVLCMHTQRLVSSLPVTTGKLRLREGKKLTQDHTACKMVDLEFTPTPIWLSHCFSGEKKNLDLFNFFFFWSQEVVHSKTFRLGEEIMQSTCYCLHLLGNLAEKDLFWCFALQ